MDSIKKDILD